MSNTVLSSNQVNLQVQSTNINVPISDINTDFLVMELISTITKQIGINNVSVNSNDNNISLDISVPWVKKLVDLITPFYTQLASNQTVNNNSLIISLVSEINKYSISDDILNLVNLNESKIDIEHFTEIIKLITDLAGFYNDIANKTTDNNIKQLLTKDNIITILTIILYVILFLIKKDNLSDKDIQWVQVTINCLSFTSIIVTELNSTFKFTNLFKCCSY